MLSSDGKLFSEINLFGYNLYPFIHLGEGRYRESKKGNKSVLLRNTTRQFDPETSALTLKPVSTSKIIQAYCMKTI